MPFKSIYRPPPLTWRDGTAYCGRAEVATVHWSERNRYESWIFGFPALQPASSCQARSHTMQTVTRAWNRCWDHHAVHSAKSWLVFNWDRPSVPPQVRELDRMVRAVATGMGFATSYISWTKGWRMSSPCGRVVVIRWGSRWHFSEYDFEFVVLEAAVNLWKSLPLPRPELDRYQDDVISY